MDSELYCDNEEEYLSSSDQYWGGSSSKKENYVLAIVLVRHKAQNGGHICLVKRSFSSSRAAHSDTWHRALELPRKF